MTIYYKGNLLGETDILEKEVDVLTARLRTIACNLMDITDKIEDLERRIPYDEKVLVEMLHDEMSESLKDENMRDTWGMVNNLQRKIRKLGW
tara:strand:- start:140 stop:415 length:276 start_codon:yes stop_codon:yes gene_type:complete